MLSSPTLAIHTVIWPARYCCLFFLHFSCETHEFCVHIFILLNMCAYMHTHIHTHTQTHTHTLFLSLSYKHIVSPLHPLLPHPPHTHTHTHSLSLSLSLLHTHTHTHTHKETDNTHAPPNPFSVFLPPWLLKMVSGSPWTVAELNNNDNNIITLKFTVQDFVTISLLRSELSST